MKRETERQRFERWAKQTPFGCHWDFRQCKLGYLDIDTQHAWLGWQARARRDRGKK